MCLDKPGSGVWKLDARSEFEMLTAWMIKRGAAPASGTAARKPAQQKCPGYRKAMRHSPIDVDSLLSGDNAQPQHGARYRGLN